MAGNFQNTEQLGIFPFIAPYLQRDRLYATF